jgi:DNA-binding response OmpR family regulator
MARLAALKRVPYEPLELDAARPGRRDTVLVLAARGPERDALARLAREQGHVVLEARGVQEALSLVRKAGPDLVLLRGDARGLEFLDCLRGDADGTGVSAIVLTRAGDTATLLKAFELGADDVVPHSADLVELAARIRARLERRAIPRRQLLRDPATGALTEETFARLLHLEVERVSRVGRPACLAFLAFHELPALEAELGQRARDAILAEVVDVVQADGRKLDVIGSPESTLPFSCRIRRHAAGRRG